MLTPQQKANKLAEAVRRVFTISTVYAFDFRPMTPAQQSLLESTIRTYAEDMEFDNRDPSDLPHGW